uniref:aromatic ring-hydroxylating oxygenase subunit alpha n=1 Tax=Pararhizobium sp. IMCC3301 TaxID=3067904 RepID=UPI0027425C3E|nr:Rieske (2Fe-2S) protein [Pararhizobium sp. IMCC3301]
MTGDDSQMTADPAGWIPVALSADLAVGGVMRAAIDGQDALDLAVWRARSGTVNAFHNRCPHRGMRLSFGFVRGERLSCIYHGWQYGEDGGCRHIPAHPDLTPPASVGATAFACTDHDGVIWVSTEPETAPGIAGFGGQGLRSIAVDAGANALRKMLEGTVFPVSGGDDMGNSEAEIIAQNRTSLVLEAGNGSVRRRLIIHFQPVGPDKTMLHLQTSPEASVNLKIALSRWAERLRWSAENLGSVTKTCHAGAGEMRP